MRRTIYNIFKTTVPHSFDPLLSLLAPQNCLGCGDVGRSICQSCTELMISPPPPRCFNCQVVSECYETCKKCRRILDVNSIFPVAPYDGIHKQIVMRMKKDASRATAKDIAQVLAISFAQQSNLQDVDIIVPVPTIAQHVRERGFDHTRLIADELSKLTSISSFNALERTSKARQVGKTRKERFEQMQNGVKLREVKKLNGVRILLIDDIATTGATLSACARVLKEVGAKRVDALVFASGN